MPKYVLIVNVGKKQIITQPVEADNHRHAMLLIKQRYRRKTEGMTNFEILDNIGVIKNECDLQKMS